MDHYHELYLEDRKYRYFDTSDTGKDLQVELLVHQMMLKEKKWNTILEEDSMKLILENRENNPSIKAARKGMVTLVATIKGLKGSAPTRKVAVPGKIPLSVLHYRVLCPIFGWTQGFHDYRFVVPPSGYKRNPPRIPMFDIIIGAQSTSCHTNYGFYGTLRYGGQKLPTISDETVCVADMLYHPGHRLWHVLGGPGWKIELTVDQVAVDDTQGRPTVLSGDVGNPPETFYLDMDLSTDFYEEDFDCGGPHAFALVHDIIKRGNRSAQDRSMKEYVKRNNLKESDFDINRSFDLDGARRDLAKAWKGLSTHNPEYSTNLMFNMFGGMNISDP